MWALVADTLALYYAGFGRPVKPPSLIRGVVRSGTYLFLPLIF